MSYCRFADGDVYVVGGVMGGIECCSCKFSETGFGSDVFWTRSSLLAHLREHSYAGHIVPVHAVLRIVEERIRLGDDLEFKPIDLGERHE